MLLEVATPQKLVMSEEVQEVVAPGEYGQFGVLPGHTPFLVSLVPGELVYKKGEREVGLAIGEGFAEVLPDRVTVLVEWAQFPDEININEVKEQMAQLEAQLGRLTFWDPEYESLRKRLKELMVKLELVRTLQSESSKTSR